MAAVVARVRVFLQNNFKTRGGRKPLGTCTFYDDLTYHLAVGNPTIARRISEILDRLLAKDTLGLPFGEVCNGAIVEGKRPVGHDDKDFVHAWIYQANHEINWDPEKQSVDPEHYINLEYA